MVNMEVQQENSPKERSRPSTPTAVDLLQIEGARIAESGYFPAGRRCEDEF
jgi:hypothetical protein